MGWFQKSKEKSDLQNNQNDDLKKIKVVLLGPINGMAVGPKDILQKSLSQADFLDFSFEEALLFENFSDIDHQNFFDFWDKGCDALKRHQADVLLRFDQVQNQIRLSFQSENMYQKNEVFFSCVHNLFLPVSFFNDDMLPTQISAILLATILSLALKKDEKYKSYLKKIMLLLGQKKLPDEIEASYVPHILVFLVLNYLSFKKESFTKEDMALTLTLMQAAQKNLYKTQDLTVEGMIYFALGQIYLCSSKEKNADALIFIGRAIDYFKKSLKFFGRYAYPYDYAQVSLILADLYIKLFNLTDDNQALRDAVFQLRAAEQILTFALKPVLWAEIEEKLGFCFSVLSSKSNSEDIALMAVNHYQNRQKVYTLEKHPKFWADSEKEIADVYYYLGKHNMIESYLEKAIDSYNKAFQIYQNMNLKDQMHLIEKCVIRADEEIMSLF